MFRILKLVVVPAIVVAVAGCAAGGLTIDAAQRLENGGRPTRRAQSIRASDQRETETCHRLPW